MATIIRLDQIIQDNSTQARRFGLNGSVVYDYAELMKAGHVFPPIVVFSDGTDKVWLADGFHRVAAAKEAGATEIAAEVRAGTQRDAMLYANGEANRDHGLQLTREDKRNRVENMLKDEEWSQWSDRQIAKHCGVSHTFVAIMRGRLQEQSGNVATKERHWALSNGMAFWSLVEKLELDKTTILEQIQPGAKVLTDLPNENLAKQDVWHKLYDLAKERIASIHPVGSMIIHLASKRVFRVTGHNAGSYGLVIFGKDMKEPDGKDEHIQADGIARATQAEIERYLQPKAPEFIRGDKDGTPLTEDDVRAFQQMAPNGNVATSDDDKLALMHTIYTYLSGNLGIGQITPLDFDELIEWLTEQRNQLEVEQTHSEIIAKNEAWYG